MDDSFECPYCGQENFLFIDPSGGSRQRMTADCEVCCRPILINLRLSGGEISSLNISKENE